jgi:GT2 family glycosyltransferase
MGDEPGCIYAAHGSAVFIRDTFFRRGGSLRFGGFMFGEEIHLAEQARRLGLSVLYLPTIRVIHGGGSTTMRVHTRERRRWHLESARVLWNQYFGGGSAAQRLNHDG